LPASRAARIGQAVSHGRCPPAPQGRSTSAEAPDDCGGLDAEHARRLRVQIADVALRIHGEHALDHSLQQRLCLGLAPPQRGGDVDQVAAHVLQRPGERRDLRRAADRDRGREVAPSELDRGSRQRLERLPDAPRQQHRREHRDAGQHGRDQGEAPDEAIDGAAHRVRRQTRLDQGNPLAGDGDHRRARCVHAALPDETGDRRAAREGLGVQLLEIRLDGVEPVGKSGEANLHADSLAERRGEATVEGPQHDDARPGQARNLGRGAERAVRQGRQRDQEAFALLGDGCGKLVPAEAPGCGREHHVVGYHGADVQSAGFAETPYEELERLGLTRPEQPRQRRPAGEQSRGGERILAVAPDLVARFETRQLDPRPGLLLGLLAQQAHASDGQRDDGDEEQPPDRERERAPQRPGARQPRPQPARELAFVHVHGVSPPSGPTAIPPAT